MHLKTPLLLLVILSLALTSVTAQDSSSYLYFKLDSSNNEYRSGYANAAGEMIVPFGKYLLAYTDTIKTIGFVHVPHRGFWAIDTKGQELFQAFSFDNGPDYVKEGLFRMVDSSGKIGYANMQGEIVIQPQYDGAGQFRDGLAFICQGCIVEKIMPGGEHWRWANGRWGFIDKTGQVVIPIEYDAPKNFPKDGKIILTKGDVMYLFDTDSLKRVHHMIK